MFTGKKSIFLSNKSKSVSDKSISNKSVSDKPNAIESKVIQGRFETLIAFLF